jgi:hypothetical protein
MRMILATDFRAAGAALALSMIVGCAGVGGSSATPEAAVQARANQRWQFLVAGKLDDAYQMLAPGYRAVKSADAYKSDLSPTVKWLSAEIAGVTCGSPEACDAKVKLEAKPIGPSSLARTNIVTYFDEKWILVDGQWWHFPNR